ncbi:MAG: hypothetical protein JSR82_08245 [Verrucomicrobia bacterium]|nr:hypothetical protein [Verrucomicrobiota bacterium]
MFCILLLLAAADLLFVARVRVKSLASGSYLLTELSRVHESLVASALGCWAVAAVLISLCVERALQPTAWVPLGVLLMRLQAVSLTLMAVFPPGLAGDGASLAPTLHQIGFYSALFFGAACPLVLAPSFRWDPEWTALTWPGRLATLLAVGTVLGLMLFPPGAGAFWEVSAVAALIFWLLLCAFGVLRSVRWGARSRRRAE